MYGLKTPSRDRKTEVHAKKPTKSMTNSRVIGEELSKKCDGQHAHQSLVDGRARHAAKYPPALCRAICRGIINIKKERHETVRTVATIAKERQGRVPDLEEFHEKAETGICARMHGSTDSVLFSRNTGYRCTCNSAHGRVRPSSSNPDCGTGALRSLP